MPPPAPFHRLVSTLGLCAALAACGGGADDGRQASAAPDDRTASILKDCSGSCSGGGGTPTTGPNPLPTTAPAPDILVRESFGPGPADVRPKGGKGDLRSAFIGVTLGGFWVEWPGSKNTAWITPSGEATWKFSSSSNGGPNFNPYELPSPLETDRGYGVVAGLVFSDVSDGATGGYPTALLPVAWPTTPWSVSIEGVIWGQTPASYIALGLTDSSTTLGNLMTASKLTLLFRPAADGASMTWELWRGGSPRSLVASGGMEDLSLNQLKLDYVPATQQLTARVNGVAVASLQINLGTPRYAAFEGHGLVDDFVVRRISATAQ